MPAPRYLQTHNLRKVTTVVLKDGRMFVTAPDLPHAFVPNNGWFEFYISGQLIDVYTTPDVDHYIFEIQNLLEPSLSTKTIKKIPKDFDSNYGDELLNSAAHLAYKGPLT